MKRLLETNLYLGSKIDYEELNDKNNWAFVHACKSYFDQLPEKVREGESCIALQNHFYINWQDLPDSASFKTEDFILALDFIDENINNKKVLIHCDWGQSRSATLAMVFLSKRLKLLPSEFLDALNAFRLLYPDYQLPSGISKFTGKHWNEII